MEAFELIGIAAMVTIAGWMIVKSDHPLSLITGAITIAVIGGISQWSTWSFDSIWPVVMSGTWIKNVLWYLLFGLGWFTIEFVLRTRRAKLGLMETVAAKYDADERAMALQHRDTADDKGRYDTTRRGIMEVSLRYFNAMPFPFLTMSNDLEVKLNRWELASMAATMIPFFPFNIVNFVFGRLLNDLAQLVGSIFNSLFGRAIKKYFSDFLKF